MTCLRPERGYGVAVLYLLRLLIACLALVSGGRVAEAAAERGAAAVTIEAPQRQHFVARVGRFERARRVVSARRHVEVPRGKTPRRHHLTRSLGPPARALFLLHRALLR